MAAGIFVAAGLPTNRASAHIFGGPGGMCNPVLKTTTFQFNSQGGANVGTQAAGLTCGAVRVSSSGPRQIVADVFDGSTTGNVTCDFIVRSFDGASLLFSATQSTGTFSFTGPQSLSVTIPSSLLGYVTVTCVMPVPGTGGNSRFGGFIFQ
jgi:hypothetical protein